MGPLAAMGISAGISGLTNIGQALYGGFQARRARRGLEDLRRNRPIYETPEAATQALGLSRQMAYGEMPGRTYTEERLGRTTAAGVRNIGRMAPSSSAALGAVTDVYGRQLEAERDLGYNAALWRAQMMQNYQAQLGQMAGYQDQAFNLNQWIPYQQQMNELQSQRMVGQQNLWGGIQGLANTASSFMGDVSQLGAMQQMFPQGGNTGTNYIPNVYGRGGSGQATPLTPSIWGTPSMGKQPLYGYG